MTGIAGGKAPGVLQVWICVSGLSGDVRHQIGLIEVLGIEKLGR
jgi:hypothetical protein